MRYPRALDLGAGQCARVQAVDHGHCADGCALHRPQVRIDIDDGVTKAFLVLTPDAAMDLAHEIRVAAESFLTRRVEP
jgi:hypothetical protein